MTATYTAEIKVTHQIQETKETDRYGSVTASTPARDERIGHITLTASNLADLRKRVAAVMEQVTDE
jgi:hypothetical protein